MTPIATSTVITPTPILTPTSPSPSISTSTSTSTSPQATSSVAGSTSASSTRGSVLANGSRSRTGCWPCRVRRVKCDERHPECQRCARMSRACDYAPRPRKKYTWQKPAIASAKANADANSSVSASASVSVSGRQRDDSQGPAEPLSASTSPSGSVPASASAPASIEGRSFASSSRLFQDQDALIPNDQNCPDASPISQAANSLPPGTAPALGTLEQPHDTHAFLIASLSAACASIIAPSDCAAIHCFRFVLSPAVDAKPPEFSGPAIVWKLAQSSPMVLHMVCALGGRKLCCSLSAAENHRLQSEAAEHYGAALRLLATAIRGIVETTDFDCILATLWLMISFERRCGDGCGVSLTAHLQGAAVLVQQRLKNVRGILYQSQSYLADMEDAYPTCNLAEDGGELSALTTQMIIWISLVDGGAAINGLGGPFNDLIGASMRSLAENTAMSRLKGYNALQTHSDLVYQEVWSADYPQSQLIEDLECSQLRCLHAESGQLRFLLSKLAVVTPCDNINQEHPSVAAISCAIRDVEMRYSRLLQVASMLNFPTQDSHRRFVINIRIIVPFYYAVVLCFFRITSGVATINTRQRKALKETMALAFQAYSNEGEEATARIAWPLFVTALESDDMVHRAWILERFKSLANQGENYRRALKALRMAFAEQGLYERRVDYWELLRRPEVDLFVL